eukprot:4247522-Pleurochrysis_carterae.AAC.7
MRACACAGARPRTHALTHARTRAYHLSHAHSQTRTFSAALGPRQEDVLLGNLSLFAPRHLLETSDVISPYLFPLNASGVLMMYRNTPTITTLWRRSAAASTVLSTSTYQAPDATEIAPASHQHRTLQSKWRRTVSSMRP